ncbi:MarR family winged helix-turn-helix transcriptional regulator [Streptomyces sp. NPDC127079]|uniref:MarR family winged helix-turn-helix transcriptional regulator n=1 Tax=Streptomyces sp. NPDC127079 TaxID=3347132 RepID=UPI0036583753
MEGTRKAYSSTAKLRWLTDEQQRIWRSYVHATTLLEDRIDRQLQRTVKMPHCYYRLLVSLAESPHQRLQMTELAMHAKITRPRLSHAVARLEKNGLVRREDAPSGKRGKFTVLTEEGLEALIRAAPGYATVVQHALFDRLTPQQQEFLGAIMQMVTDGLQTDGAGADLPWLR